jgi:hypothetical protein
MSVGNFATLTPAFSKDLILESAVPLPRAIMAPACPIRLPGGAVRPAINAKTGLLIYSVICSAASSSAVPPISPTRTIAFVSGSYSKAFNESIKVVPIIGSPPRPTHVL